MSELTEKLKSKSCGEISCDQCDDERLEAANKIEYLLIQNLRLQLDLDASCNAEELRQYRHANQFLIVNQGAYERDNARLKWLIRQVTTDLPVNRDWLNPDYEREMRSVSALPNVV